jgi:hypothetical protein
LAADLRQQITDESIASSQTALLTAQQPPSSTAASHPASVRKPAARQNPPAAHLIGRTGCRPVAPTMGAAAQITSFDGLADDDLGGCTDHDR